MTSLIFVQYKVFEVQEWYYFKAFDSWICYKLRSKNTQILTEQFDFKERKLQIKGEIGNSDSNTFDYIVLRQIFLLPASF